MATIKELKFRHFFTIGDNNQLIFEDKGMFELILSKLKSSKKKVYLTFHEQEEDITVDQYAFYFGGIIRHECMPSNIFFSLTEKEIHSVLFNELRSHTVTIAMPDGTRVMKTVSEDFSRYKKDDMSKYLEELIPYLATEYNIHIKDRSKYDDLNKYVEEPKIFKPIKKYDKYWNEL